MIDTLKVPLPLLAICCW